MSTEAEDSDNDFFDCLEDVDEIGKFYAIALPQDKWTDRKGAIAVDFNDAMKKLKEIKGSRLKVFPKFQEAERFADTPAENLVSPQSKEKIRMRRDVDPFPNVSQRDLNDFRTCIDRGDVVRIVEMVRNNPRYLVNDSDIPTVLQIKFRYNAIHQCCHRGQSEILRRILMILNTDTFWHSLHPTVDEVTHAVRKECLLDRFLNSPDVGCLETPLHFATKFGHVECVKTLVEHPQCRLEALNRDKRTASEIVCTRYTVASDRKERRRSILDVLCGRFVLLVEEDGCSAGKVLSPCGWREYQRWRKCDRRLRAYAGPMNEDDAAQFYRLLRLPVRKLARSSLRPGHCDTVGNEFELFSAKLADTEKGFERAGRYLASKFGVPWMEFWPFVDDFIDLSSEAGLSLLEDHVSSQASQITWNVYREHTGDSTEDDIEGLEELKTPDTSMTSSFNGDSWLSPLSRLFSRLTVRSPPPSETSPIPSPPPSLSCTPVRPPKSCFASSSTPKPSHRTVRSLTGHQELEKLDVHVFHALEQLDSGKLLRFPQVRQWRENVAEEVLEMSPRRSHSWHQGSVD